MQPYQQEFIEYAINAGVLQFGDFKLKSGRSSPYFFNTGLFNTGRQLSRLGYFYANALIHSKLQTDMLYGPAYKGIPLVSAAAIALAEHFDIDIPFCFNRKEAKDHGEGGNLVGAPLSDSVLILDDVITAGTSVRESVSIIERAGARPCGVLIALDRQEQSQNSLSAVSQVSSEFGIPVYSVISLKNIIEYLNTDDKFRQQVQTIVDYRQAYGDS